jgi:vacuolar-type H+-ATPase subunit H
VRAIVDYCLDGNWIDGQTTVKRMTDQSETPGLLCNFRLGYETADESDETEEFVPLFVTCEEEIESEIPETNGSIPPDTADEYPQVQQVAEKAETLIEMAEREAQRRVEEMAEEAEKEKSEAVDIKRQHAERYFQNAIGTWESRLEQYREDDKQGKDMTISIRQAQSEIEELQEERKREFDRLRQEESVLPKRTDLVNTAVLISN